MALLVIGGIAAAIMRSTGGSNGPYNIDPRNEPGKFEPHLARYNRLAEFIIGLATGSIVLLVGSSALHGNGGRLPWFFASPLLILAFSVLCGVGFMACLILVYEKAQHGDAYTRFRFIVTNTAGFGSLALFCIGYIWLILAVTR